MKTSIFDMNFILPPMIEMSEVVKTSISTYFHATCFPYC